MAAKKKLEATPQDFIERYQSLVKETGHKIVVNPAYKLNEKGEYVTVLQTGVGKV